MIALSREGCRENEDQHQLHIRDLKRRLGTAKIDEIVAAYAVGSTTTELMATYNISKTGVLALLASRSATMRHQPMTQEQLDQATKLYITGLPLAALSKQLGVPHETLRRGLVDTGIAMRPRGRQSTKN